MKIALGSDHAGFDLKEHLHGFVTSLGHEVIDVGTDSTESVDYPDYAEKVALAVVGGHVDRGIMLAGGGALVRGISDLISHETGIFTHVAEDPLLCVVNGCGQVLEDYKRLQRVLDTPEFVRSASSL